MFAHISLQTTLPTYCNSYIPLGVKCDDKTSLNLFALTHTTRRFENTCIYAKYSRMCSSEYAQTIPGYIPRTKNFRLFCTAFIPPVPGTSTSSVRQCHEYPGYGYIISSTYVSSVRPSHNTRNFCEFCNISLPCAEFLSSSVTSSHDKPELLWLL